ncbi:hypothetical protein E2562_021878 [Oryza meyeriana var. granulata]|uniref:Uncharacterized protein n=1 Tax=Oryza meyeriana var. granulata TaxID=110450 RepID=A0A6G1C9Q9_9ORYZ|nr:hypothetical protein E2562_021878 [Oryza meyeriana var. granulata]
MAFVPGTAYRPSLGSPAEAAGVKIAYMYTAASGGGGSHGVAGIQLQEFAYFMVIDLEATCERGRRVYP